MTLIQEKVRQAAGLLREFGVDCWITFTRESEINGDPTLRLPRPGPPSPGTRPSSSAPTAGRGPSSASTTRRRSRRPAPTTRSSASSPGIKEPLHAYPEGARPAGRSPSTSPRASEICDGLTHGMYLTLREFLAEIGMADRLVSAETIVSALRERKSAAEIGWMKRGRPGDRGDLRPGRRRSSPRAGPRSEIAAFILAEVERRELAAGLGPRRPARPSSPGPDTAQAHYAPTGRTVEPGHVLNMDFGVKVDGYCSDMQRTFYVLAAGRDGRARRTS